MKIKILIVAGVLIAISGTALAMSWMWKGTHDKAMDDTNSQTLGESTDNSSEVPTGSGLANQDSGQSAAAQALGNQPAQQQQSTSQIDPSTFGQYEKYKNDKQALFADIQKGDGAELTVNKKAVVVYKGWLTNGQVFDQSRTNSQGQLEPFSYTLGAHQVIIGWEQSTAGMKVGGSRLLIIPPAVGYGSTPTGSIPANSVLVFEVQLLAVQ